MVITELVLDDTISFYSCVDCGCLFSSSSIISSGDMFCCSISRCFCCCNLLFLSIDLRSSSPNELPAESLFMWDRDLNFFFST
jgi:hypothetical protein